LIDARCDVRAFFLPRRDTISGARFSNFPNYEVPKP
jgi:hypothetical protein